VTETNTGEAQRDLPEWERRLNERVEREHAEEARKRQCAYILTEGRRCGGTPKVGHQYCWSHELYRRRTYAGHFFVPLLEDGPTIRLTISEVLQAMLMGNVQPQIARTVVSGCVAALGVLRYEQAERRLQAQLAGRLPAAAPAGDGEDVIVNEEGDLTLKDPADRVGAPSEAWLEEARNEKPPEPALFDPGYEASEGKKARPREIGFGPEPWREKDSLAGLTDEQISDQYHGRITMEEARAGLTAAKKAEMEEARAEAGKADEAAAARAEAEDSGAEQPGEAATPAAAEERGGTIAEACAAARGSRRPGCGLRERGRRGVPARGLRGFARARRDGLEMRAVAVERGRGRRKRRRMRARGRCGGRAPRQGRLFAERRPGAEAPLIRSSTA
jgi:hypothetical protein